MITNIRSPPPCRDRSVEASAQFRPSSSEPNRRWRLTYDPTSLLNRCPTPAGARDNSNAAPTTLGGQNPKRQQHELKGNQLERKNHAQPPRVRLKQTQRQQETGIEPATPFVTELPLTTTLSLRFNNNNTHKDNKKRESSP